MLLILFGMPVVQILLFICTQQPVKNIGVAVLGCPGCRKSTDL